MLKKIWRALSGKGDFLLSNEQIVFVLALVLGVYHTGLLCLYMYYEMNILTFVNVFSVLLYASCAVAAKFNVKPIYLLRTFFAEILFQVLIAGILLGSHCGFQFYLVALTCQAFYTGYIYRNDDRINAMHYVLIELVAFVLLCFFNAYVPPTYTFRDERMVDILYAVNFFTAVSAMVMALGNLLAQITHLEGKLLQQNRDLEVLSRTDALTGLVNRRSIEENYNYVMQHSKMYAVIIADIDDFKVVNDTFGHNIGDAVLRQAADIFKSSVRGDDMVCRWGGEEILIFLPLCKKDGAELTARRILGRIREASVPLENGEEIYYTMTFGVADSGEGAELREVIQKADNRLYEGKQNGKNCVVAGKMY